MDAMETALDEMLVSSRSEARQLSKFEWEEEQLRAETKRLDELYDTTILHLKEINLVRDAGGFEAQILARPGNGNKVAPLAWQILPVGCLLGLLGGFGLAYLAELSDKSFRNPEEIRRRLGLHIVGHIPLLQPDPVATEKIATGQDTLNPYLCVYHRPKSIGAEAYRSVRTALYFSTQGIGHSVIQITSPETGDGKSTLAANLALSIAQSGKRTLLIDADLRRPQVHKLFALRTGAGLADVLGGQQIWRAAVQESPMPGLSLLPAGPLPPNPAELLTSPRFADLLEVLRGEYDFVLVDTPPLLAVTDPCVVAPRVDGVLLTIRLSRNCIPQAERARQILTTLGVNTVGVVVNGVSRHQSRRLHIGQYEYSYLPNDYTSQDSEPDESHYFFEEDDPRASSETPRSPTSRSGDGVVTRHTRLDKGSSTRNGPKGLMGWLKQPWS